MHKFLYAIICIFLFSALFSFIITPVDNPSKKVKKDYFLHLDTFLTQVQLLKPILLQGNTKKVQAQFFNVRESYKKVEVFIEYFFDSYATVLNGPPIPFFDEKEPYKLENPPLGMQVIETLLFPEYDKKNTKELEQNIEELIKHIDFLQDATESHEFSDANIFDAFIEEIYRITALGITGFDSQAAQNTIAECNAALKGLEHFISYYEIEYNEKLPGKYNTLKKLFNNASGFLEKNASFNNFDRLNFITAYLNPITTIIGEYKIANNYPDNPSGGYYTAIRKNKTLFTDNAFSFNQFLGDFTISPGKINFGKALFFEKQLSSTNKQSCASCHQPNKAFTDGLKTSTALDGHSSLKRNAPTLWNAALQRNLFLDSRSRSMEDQILQVLNNADEMHGSAKSVVEKILNIPKYKDLYSKAYPNATADNMVNNICNAIASYERTLIALNSKFDIHMRGQKTLNKKEINGFNLFMGKAKCGTCHFMPLFSGAKPPRYYYIESEVLGTPSDNSKSKPMLDKDSGRYLTTQINLHLFSFKTPSLRNVALTAPYMHNGVFNTLEEVVEFYNNGGGQGLGIAPPNQTLPFEKLSLTKKEKKELILFMKSLTDTISVIKATD